MGGTRWIKLGLVLAWALGGLLLAASGSRTEAAAPAGGPADEYVGSDTCKVCHEATFASYAHTKHARLAASDDDMRGCESCHGPGKAHAEAGGDKSKILSFDGKSEKEISETCLKCHTGNDEHNNYRRGEHWRNDVGCTTCHSSHPGPPPPTRAHSTTLVSPVSVQKPDEAGLRMLTDSDPQLCLKCHNEQKAQFTQPFHHKVLEGAMKCSDCHNPHGGFDAKQTRLASGADAMCVKCHTDKQGPFVFEHAPVRTDGCISCHSTHGSQNPKMLTRSAISQQCLECHSNIGGIGGPNTPSFHNLATARIQSCTTCHVKIHGSHTDRFYFK
jgi:predicted CXXCH cytochrome family protein